MTGPADVPEVSDRLRLRPARDEDAPKIFVERLSTFLDLGAERLVAMVPDSATFATRDLAPS